MKKNIFNNVYTNEMLRQLCSTMSKQVVDKMGPHIWVKLVMERDYEKQAKLTNQIKSNLRTDFLKLNVNKL